MVEKKRQHLEGDLLRADDVRLRLGRLGATQFNELLSRGELPAPIRLTASSRLNFWLKSEIDEFIAARIAARNLVLRDSSQSPSGAR